MKNDDRKTYTLSPPFPESSSSLQIHSTNVQNGRFSYQRAPFESVENGEISSNSFSRAISARSNFFEF